MSLSDDLCHDAAAVKANSSLAEKCLVQKHKINRVIQFTDCCDMQCRSKKALLDISNSTLVTERHYIEAGHGKPPDGLGTLVKNAATRAVTRRQCKILNASDFFQFCTENLSEVEDSMKETGVIIQIFPVHGKLSLC